MISGQKHVAQCLEHMRVRIRRWHRTLSINCAVTIGTVVMRQHWPAATAASRHPKSMLPPLSHRTQDHITGRGDMQANRIEDVGPAAAVVLARLLTLLRSPSAPILPDNVRLFRIDAHPALAMVRPVTSSPGGLQHQSLPTLTSSQALDCALTPDASLDSARLQANMNCHGPCAEGGACIITCAAQRSVELERRVLAPQEVVTVCGTMLEQGRGSDPDSVEGRRIADLVHTCNEVSSVRLRG